MSFHLILMRDVSPLRSMYGYLDELWVHNAVQTASSVSGIYTGTCEFVARSTSNQPWLAPR